MNPFVIEFWKFILSKRPSTFLRSAGMVKILLCAILVFVCMGLSLGNAMDDPKTQTISPSKDAGVNYLKEENDILDAIANYRLPGFLGKTFNKLVAERLELIHRRNPKTEPINTEHELKMNLNTKLLQNIFIAPSIYQGHGFNLSGMYANGCVPIIPQNPYTGNDVKTSLEYSPGDFLVAANEKAFIYIQHYGPLEPECVSPLEVDYTRLFYTSDYYFNNELTDGRTFYVFLRDTGNPNDDIFWKLPIKRQSDLSSIELTKLNWLGDQVQIIMTTYSDFYNDFPDTLDDLINYFGRKNPAAWINPYTNKPMEQLPKFAALKSLQDSLSDYLDYPDSPSDIYKPEYINKYAGNYSFVTIKGEDSATSYFVLYIKDKKGKLGVIKEQVTSVRKKPEPQPSTQFYPTPEPMKYY